MVKEAWQVTRREFVGEWPVYDGKVGQEEIYGKTFDKSSRQSIMEMTSCLNGILPNMEKLYGSLKDRKILTQSQVRDDFFLIVIPKGNVALLHRDEDGWDVVGGYMEETLWIYPTCRGIKNENGLSLGSELILQAWMERDGELLPVKYTTAGRIAHERAHEMAVKMALLNGKTPPSNVMDDYPLMNTSILSTRNPP